MFPLTDENPHSKIPYVNYFIIGVNIFLFLFEISFPIQSLKILFYNYGVVPARYFSPSLVSEFSFSSNPLIPFFSSMFLHGGWLHIIFNMWALFIFGDNVEDKLGHFNYLLFYLGSGLIAGIIHAIFNYNSIVPSIGASGAIAGVMAAYVILFPGANIKTLFIIFFFPIIVSVPALIFVCLWFFSQLFTGTLSLFNGASGGTAWWAHIGGFIAGVGLLFMFKKKKKRLF
jgi:membrane associated rhomboid family serine protease